MPTKKKVTPKKRTRKIKKVDIKEIKKDLVEDLDQFLLAEEDILDAKKAKEEKKRALDKLDKLIKEELTYNQILKQAKKDIIDKAQEESDLDNNEYQDVVNYVKQDNIVRSGHVLDLRQQKEIEATKIKKAKLERYQSKWQRLKEKFTRKSEKTKKVEFHKPKTSGINLKRYFYININLQPLKLKYVASKVLVFTLVLAVIVLPIRGLVLFGKLQDDKNKLFELGKQGVINLQAGVISASENSYENAQIGFEEALYNFDQAQRTLDNYQDWMLEAAGSVPVVGKKISLSRNMLAVATNISQAGSILNQKLHENSNLTEYLETIHQQVKETLPYLEEAQKDLEKINIDDLPLELKPHFEGLANYLPSITQDLKSLDDIFSLLVELLGHDGEKRYLILFQNNNELRATGGFIGSFSLLDVYQGKIVGLETPGGGTYDL
ncbi:hypothetical protein C0580_00490, partial [Candidatus Parcubacteria bacterium]